jgi:hypothetical protein
MCKGLGTLEKRIESRFIKDEKTGCLNWTSYLNKDGYAVIAFKKKRIRVAKFILERALGRPLKKDFETCHKCNNRKCINIDHLYEGTHKQNGQDMVNSLNFSCPGAKIKHGEKTKFIKKTFNVSKNIVFNIRHEKNWSWL